MVNMAPVEVTFRPEGEYWLAFCPALDVATQGKTYEEAQYNLKDALMLFFESCIRRGTLTRVLQEAGYEPVRVKQVQDYLEEYIPAKFCGAGAACRA